MQEEHDDYLDEKYYILRNTLGEFLRKERKGLGYKNALELAVKLGMSDTQLRAYERGEEDMQLSTLYKLLKGLAKDPEIIFKEIISRRTPVENLPPNTLPPAKEHQLRQQVEEWLGAEEAAPLSSEDLYRLNEIIRLVSHREARKSEIRDAVNLKSYNRAFNRIIGLAIRGKFIRMKYPDIPNHKNQRYLTGIKP